MRGIVLSATGERYVAAAIEAARRSELVNALPHAVFCCPAQEAEGLQMIPFESSGDPHLDKIASMAASPFDETIYLDVDCFVVEPIVDLFELLAIYDLAAAQAPGYRGAADPEVPVSFFEINTGVMAYAGGERVRQMMRDWFDTYQSWLAEPPFPGADGRPLGQDQPAFRRCLWRSGLRAYILGPEYNWRFLAPSFLCGAVKVIHGFVTDPDELAARVNRPPLRPRAYPRLNHGHGIDSEVESKMLIARLDAPGS